MVEIRLVAVLAGRRSTDDIVDYKAVKVLLVRLLERLILPAQSMRSENSSCWDSLLTWANIGY